MKEFLDNLGFFAKVGAYLGAWAILAALALVAIVYVLGWLALRWMRSQTGENRLRRDFGSEAARSFGVVSEVQVVGLVTDRNEPSVGLILFGIDSERNCVSLDAASARQLADLLDRAAGPPPSHRTALRRR